jgi:hypothetical protein
MPELNMIAKPLLLLFLLLLFLLALQEFASMMVPAYEHHCSAAQFANSWLKQQQAKQQQADAEDWGDLKRGPSGIKVQRDQAPVPVRAA